MREEIQNALELGRTERWDDAIAKMKLLVDEEPTADHWAYLGTTYRSCSRWNDADAAYARALAADGAHAEVLRGLDERYAAKLDSILRERGLLPP